ncbi:MAG: SagB/ThcOx family dehydrogenase [Anaerolineaceae bacterium]|nr:SagB/ThcOx family dehydrogenase [Anaerolineaceae bacterium]MBN2678421.1 SagB/ThcOx family dehydrogenase [Anaerolineaceae bacterium]
MSQITPAHEYLEKSKYQFLSPSGQQRGEPQPALEVPCDPRLQRIPLPKPSEIKLADITLRKAVEKRISHRDYARQSLTVEEFAYLLWMTQGVRFVKEGKLTNRNVPSAGARHALETYLAVNLVEKLEPGLYRYLALTHELVALHNEPDFSNRLKVACRNQEHILSSAVTFIWVSVLDRMSWRYSERSYRYLFLDAGHVCQNLYLAAEQIHCGVCAIAAFDDDDVNSLLGLDGQNIFATYLASLGKTSI